MGTLLSSIKNLTSPKSVDILALLQLILFRYMVKWIIVQWFAHQAFVSSPSLCVYFPIFWTVGILHTLPSENVLLVS